MGGEFMYNFTSIIVIHPFRWILFAKLNGVEADVLSLRSSNSVLYFGEVV